jgi:hypothetical protein
LFHILRDAHRLTQRSERKAYQAIESVERARQADLEAKGIIRRRGPRLKIKTPLPQAELEETQAIQVLDIWCWLLNEIRSALEPITSAGRFVSVAETRATLETAVELLKSLACADITAFAEDFQAKIPDLIAPLEWLELHLTPLLDDLDADTQAFIAWAWQHQHALNLDIDSDFPQHLRSVGHAVWDILKLFHRSSSLAESLHSWLRPYLQIHRGMPQWLLPLLQVFWNHHVFERGKRAGSSPLLLAGIQDAPSLSQVLDHLLRLAFVAQQV